MQEDILEALDWLEHQAEARRSKAVTEGDTDSAEIAEEAGRIVREVRDEKLNKPVPFRPIGWLTSMNPYEVGSR